MLLLLFQFYCSFEGDEEDEDEDDEDDDEVKDRAYSIEDLYADVGKFIGEDAQNKYEQHVKSVGKDSSRLVGLSLQSVGLEGGGFTFPRDVSRSEDDLSSQAWSGDEEISPPGTPKRAQNKDEQQVKSVGKDGSRLVGLSLQSVGLEGGSLTFPRDISRSEDDLSSEAWSGDEEISPSDTPKRAQNKDEQQVKRVGKDGSRLKGPLLQSVGKQGSGFTVQRDVSRSEGGLSALGGKSLWWATVGDDGNAQPLIPPEVPPFPRWQERNEDEE